MKLTTVTEEDTVTEERVRGKMLREETAQERKVFSLF